MLWTAATREVYVQFLVPLALGLQGKEGEDGSKVLPSF